jgi:hypothetical protein
MRPRDKKFLTPVERIAPPRTYCHGGEKSVNGMCTFVRRDLIAEKLEIARTLGLVTKYSLRPGETGEVNSVSLRVWRGPGATEPTIRAYLIRLLDGLVSDQQIVVTGEGEVPARPERVDGARIAPISAAA